MIELAVIEQHGRHYALEYMTVAECAKREP
jgi:hypothetical protein